VRGQFAYTAILFQKAYLSKSLFSKCLSPIFFQKAYPPIFFQKAYNFCLFGFYYFQHYSKPNLSQV